jgi:predicted deacetylase
VCGRLDLWPAGPRRLLPRDGVGSAEVRREAPGCLPRAEGRQALPRDSEHLLRDLWRAAVRGELDGHPAAAAHDHDDSPAWVLIRPGVAA